jgi:hypothetical protein
VTVVVHGDGGGGRAVVGGDGGHRHHGQGQLEGDALGSVERFAAADADRR